MLFSCSSHIFTAEVASVNLLTAQTQNKNTKAEFKWWRLVYRNCSRGQSCLHSALWFIHVIKVLICVLLWSEHLKTLSADNHLWACIMKSFGKDLEMKDKKIKTQHSSINLGRNFTGDTILSGRPSWAWIQNQDRSSCYKSAVSKTWMTSSKMADSW